MGAFGHVGSGKLGKVGKEWGKRRVEQLSKPSEMIHSFFESARVNGENEDHEQIVGKTGEDMGRNWGKFGEKRWGKPVFIHTTSSGYSIVFLNHL